MSCNVNCQLSIHTLSKCANLRAVKSWVDLARMFGTCKATLQLLVMMYEFRANGLKPVLLLGNKVVVG